MIEDQKISYKHSVSCLLIAATNRFERREITKTQLLAIVDSLDVISVDESQAKFFDAFRKLVDKVEDAITKEKAE